MSGDTQAAKFDEVDDASRIHKFFSVVSHLGITITLWLKNQSFKFEVKISHHVPGSSIFNVRLPHDVDLEAFQAAVATQGNAEILGSFRADNLNFFFKSMMEKRENDGFLTIAIPKKLFRLQRRANVRIPFKRSEAPVLNLKIGPRTEDTAEINKIPDAFRVIDLSAGGVAIATTMSRKPMFEKGVQLHQIRFKIRGHEITTDGEVLHVQEITSDKQKTILKVGIQFKNLSPEFEKVLVQFAMEESRKLFSQLYS